jgi:hypothetical protein
LAQRAASAPRRSSAGCTLIMSCPASPVRFRHVQLALDCGMPRSEAYNG